MALRATIAMPAGVSVRPFQPSRAVANSAELAAEFGDRIRVVQLPHVSHAILPEQPASVTAVIDAYLSGERDQATVQAAVDHNVHIPRNS